MRTKIFLFGFLVIVLSGIVFGDFYMTDNSNYVDYYNITNISHYCVGGVCIDSWDDVNASGNASGDITAVNTNGDYLTGGSDTGDVDLLLNETKLNSTISAIAVAGDKWNITGSKWVINDSNSLDWNETKGNSTYLLSSNEGNLNVGSSDYWDSYNIVSDLNYLILSYWQNITGRPTHLGNFTDNLGDRGYDSLSNFTNDEGYFNSEANLTNLLDDNYRADSWNNLTGIPHATPSDNDVTHFSLADEIYDYIVSLAYTTLSHLQTNYYNKTETYTQAEVLALNSSWNYTVNTDDQTCAEVSGCVENAITDGNTNWDNSYGFFDNITNFTGTLTNAKWCLYDSANTEIDCNVDPITDTTIGNCSTDQICVNVLYTTDNYLGGLSCSDTQIGKWNNTSGAWECENDDTGAGGTITGSGTSGKITKWTSGSAVGDSIITESGTNISIAGNLTSSYYCNSTHCYTIDEFFDDTDTNTQLSDSDILALGYNHTSDIQTWVNSNDADTTYTAEEDLIYLDGIVFKSNETILNNSIESYGYSTATGTVTSIATTAPISGGTITTTGTLSLTACADTEIYKYNSTSGAWECEADETGGDAGGAPSNANYLVGTAHGNLSAEIVVGTTPGGELGGTWASPTIDDSISVSSWSLTTPTVQTTQLCYRDSDTPVSAFILGLRKARDGDPTDDVSDEDYLGYIRFEGYHTDGYDQGAIIQAVVDNTPGNSDMPSRLEFLTSADGSSNPTLRGVIDSSGNWKFGDGAWTNYLQISNSGAMTFAGTGDINLPDDSVDAGDINTINCGSHCTWDATNDEIDVSDDWWNAYADFMGATTTDKWCKWNGTAIDCNVDVVTDTTYTAGNKLYLTNTEFNVNDTEINSSIESYGYSTEVGTVTSVATDGTYLTGGAITTTGTVTFNTTLAGTSLAVNSSDYWDGLGSPSDINAADITDDGTYRLQSWNNLTGIPHATPSDNDVTHFSLADEIYDWVIGLAYATTSYVDSLGNWTQDKSDYWNTSTDLDTVISTDEITELKIDFNTVCAAGNHLYVNGNNLACEADDDTTYTAGGGITLTGNEFNHTDTSSQASSNNAGRTYIQDIILDTYGHITSIVTATETVTNTDTQDLSYDTGTDVISLVNGGSIDITEVDTDTHLTEDQVEAYILDSDNTANMDLNNYNITGVSKYKYENAGDNVYTYFNGSCIITVVNSTSFAVCP